METWTFSSSIELDSRISIFINMGDVQGDTYYRYTREYNSAFPTGLTNWVLLRDYNCDGKEDIFANYYSGINIVEEYFSQWRSIL